MARIGSDSGLVGNNSGGVFDDSGNPIVTADTEFGASPLGIAARSQALYFLPNPSFNILPPDPSSPIVDNANALPYWSVEDLSEGRMFATTVFDETAQTWALEIDPTAGSASDSIAIKTRSYLLNDSNFDLRQKALASLEKINAYAGTTQWALTLSAEYFDATNTSLSAFTIGTAADNATWTSLSGFTTSGTAIVNAAAQYVDLTFTLTTTAAVTSTVKVHINSILLQTSTAGGGGGSQSFLISETFTSGTTWVRPTGVEYVDILCLAAGGGGGGGAVGIGTASNIIYAMGGAGGGGGALVYAPQTYVGNLGTVTIGVGAKGIGGAGTSYTKAAGTTAGESMLNGADGGAGGASSFGTIVVADGGGIGSSGKAKVGGTPPTPRTGGPAGTANILVYPNTLLVSGAGGDAGTATVGTTSAGTPTTQSSKFSFPLIQSYPGAAQDGGSATISGTATTLELALPRAGHSGTFFGGGGGCGATAQDRNTAPAITSPAGIATGCGGGGGGAYSARLGIASGTALMGNGGSASASSGAGGGGGGSVLFSFRSSNVGSSVVLSASSGAGGNGGDGFVIISYIA